MIKAGNSHIALFITIPIKMSDLIVSLNFFLKRRKKERKGIPCDLGGITKKKDHT